VLLVMPFFWFGIFSAFSGQIIYNNWMYQVFNVIFAAFPIMVYAIFDKELDYYELERKP
jgi:phospholipid-transporting ATPase